MNSIKLSRSRLVFLAGIGIVALIGALILWSLSRDRADERTPVSTHSAGPAMAGGNMNGMDGTKTSGMNMSANGTVQLTASQLRQFGVTFGGVEERTLENTVRTVGTVAVDETKLSEVVPRFGGYVERLYVDETGQQVRQGQPLMDIYSPELVAAEQELLIAGTLQQSIGASKIGRASCRERV